MRTLLPSLLLLLLSVSACRNCPDPSTAPPSGQKTATLADSSFPRRLDSLTIQGEGHYVSFFTARPEISPHPNAVNVVVEIPTGSTEKWEVDKTDGTLKWQIDPEQSEDGKPRTVKYLGYPGNYGMIPRTLLPKEAGGDGDPLDIILPGPPIPQGQLVQARIIGVLRLLDRGEQDDKLIAVTDNSPFRQVHGLEAMRAQFPGTLEIIEAWFSNYKGAGKMKSLGYGDETEAQAILEKAIAAYPKE